MSKSTIECSNCGAPIDADPFSLTVKCQYCKHNVSNPSYREPDTQLAPSTYTVAPSGGSSKGMVLVSIAVFVLLMGIGTVAFLTASQEAPPSNGQGNTPGVTQEDDAPLSPQQSLEKKMDGYLACIERAYPRGKQSMERYLSWVHPEEGPTCQEQHVGWGLYELYEDAPGRCKEFLAAANPMAPPMPQVEAAANNFLAALEKALPIVAEGAGYYEKEMYLVDDCAKGERLHPQLMTAFGDLVATHDTLKSLVAARLEGSLQDCLDRTGANSAQVGGHQWANLIAKGSHMLDQVSLEMNAEMPDLAVFKREIAIMNEAAAAVTALSDAQKEAAGYHWSHEDAVEEFIEVATRLLKDDFPDEVFADLLPAFNEMLYDYNNNMKFCGGLPVCDEKGCPAR